MPINTALTVAPGWTIGGKQGLPRARGLIDWSSDLPVGLFCDTRVQSQLQKYFTRPVGQISGTDSRRLQPRGALANVINAAGDAVDADGAV